MMITKARAVAVTAALWLVATMVAYSVQAAVVDPEEQRHNARLLRRNLGGVSGNGGTVTNPCYPWLAHFF
jgi:hypothetical protein